MTEEELQSVWIDDMQKTVGVLYTSNQLLTRRLDDLTQQMKMIEVRSEAILESKREADKLVAQLQEELSPGRRFNRKIVEPDGTPTTKPE